MSTEKNRSTSVERAQANLPALAVALLLVGGSVGVAVGLASSAFAVADTDPEDARLAASIAERLVSANGPFSVRANVLSRAAIRNANWDWLPDGIRVHIALDGHTILSRGNPIEGVTIRRIVLISNATTREIIPTLKSRDVVTLPRRSTAATLTLNPRFGTNITTVYANERVVLHNKNGLHGTYTVTLSRYDTVRFRFNATRDLTSGSVRIAYRAEDTTKAILAVTIDA